jgi:hypothetical protein
VAVEGRTRAILSSRLGVQVIERREETYRTSLVTALDGDWLGGYVQPGVILQAATATRVSISAGRGRSVDEYGPAALTILKNDGERVELTKEYARRNGAFRYVGRLSNGTLSGYWYSLQRPAFCGVFWLARTERLTDQTVRAFERGVQTWSSRRVILIVGLLLLVAMTVSGNRYAQVAALLVWVGGYAVYGNRARTLKAEVERWRSLLG